MEKGKQYMNIESTVKPSQCTNRASGTSQTFANISKTNKSSTSAYMRTQNPTLESVNHSFSHCCQSAS